MRRWCCKTYCNGCMNLAWAFFWGGSRSTKPCVFLCNVAAASDARYLVCAAGAAALVSSPNRFLLCVLQRVVVRVCVVKGCFGSCRSQWNGCMIGVTFCCHVQKKMRVCHMMLQNALQWLHECCMHCMGFVLGRKPEHVCFSAQGGCSRR